MRRAVYVVVLLLAWAGPLQAQPAPRPVEDFAALPFMQGPQLSPDGKKVAAQLAAGGRQVLAIISLFEVDKKPVLINVGDIDLNSWRWVNDEWLVARIGASKFLSEAGDDWYLRRALGISVEGKITPSLGGRMVGQMADDVIWVARDGTPRILMAVQRSIYVDSPEFWPEVSEIDVSTGKWRKLVMPRQGVMDWYADRSGNVRMGIGYNDTDGSSRLLYRGSNKDSFRVLDRARTREDESLTVPALFFSDPTKALTFSNHEGYDWLYEMALPSLTVGKKVFGVDGYDLSYVNIDETGNQLIAVSYETDRERVHWFDADMAAIQASLDKAVAPEWASIVSSSRDRKMLLVRVGNASTPGSYYVYAVETGVMRRIAVVNEKLKGWRGGPVSTVRYKARDGVEMSAVLTLPPGRPARDLPLIVLPHGGPEARDVEQYDWWAQFLADRGYAVVQPNYRGSTGFGQAFLDKGFKQWGLAMQDDLLDAVAYLAEQKTIDPKRVCIVGASYGGYAALRGAQRDGSAYRCAISYAGVSSLDGMIRYDRTFLNRKTATLGWKEAAEDLKSVSPLNGPEQFSTPTLIMHGAKDLRVPVRQSRNMSKALQRAGKTVRYIEQPQGDHYFSREADRLQFLQEMEAFLQQYNPA